MVGWVSMTLLNLSIDRYQVILRVTTGTVLWFTTVSAMLLVKSPLSPLLPWVGSAIKSMPSRTAKAKAPSGTEK